MKGLFKVVRTTTHVEDPDQITIAPIFPPDADSEAAWDAQPFTLREVTDEAGFVLDVDEFPVRAGDIVAVEIRIAREQEKRRLKC